MNTHHLTIRTRHARSVAAGVLALAFVSCAERASSHGCLTSAGASSWRTMMRDSVSGFEVLGTIEVSASGGSTRLIATSPDGMREPLSYSLEDVHIAGDTLSFRFAPIGFQVRVHCTGRTTAQGTFARPQPPFDSIRGTVRLTREDGAP